MNASELSNQALAKLLYERNTSALYLSQQSKQSAKDKRSRNVDSGLGGNTAAGQSTSSFFNTKKMLNASSLLAASQGSVSNDPKIEKPMMLQSNSYVPGKNFFENLREEIAGCSNEFIKSLMPDY
jgi:RecA-family ATPase